MRFQDNEAIDLLEDCWAQFSCDAGDSWRHDGALSTLECLADFLHERGRLEKHPIRPWYRFPTKATYEHLPI